MLPSTSRNFLHRVQPCRRHLAGKEYSPTDLVGLISSQLARGAIWASQLQHTHYKIPIRVLVGRFLARMMLGSNERRLEPQQHNLLLLWIGCRLNQRNFPNALLLQHK